MTRRLHRRDDGAVLIVAAVFVVVAFVFVAIVVDLGDLRQEEKEVTLSTDAAALAAAALVDLDDLSFTDIPIAGEQPCGSVNASSDDNPEGFATLQDVADDYLARNGGSNPVDCRVARTGLRTGYVLVSADETVDYQIPLDVASGVVAGVSVAAFESSTGGGLRPLGISAVTEPLSGPSMPDMILEANFGNPAITLNGGAGHLVRFPKDKLQDPLVPGCGVAPGNFGKLDLDGGSNPNSCQVEGGFCYQMENGYHGQVDPIVEGSPGNAFDNSTGAMDQLIASGVRFWVPVYTTVTGNGANSMFTISHFMEVVFEGYCVKNNCRVTHTDGEKYQYFDWRAYRIVPYSLQGPPVTADAQTFAPRLCAVTDAAADIATSCVPAP